MGTAERVWADVNRWMEGLVRDAVELAEGIDVVGHSSVASDRSVSEEVMARRRVSGENPFTAPKDSDYAAPSLRYAKAAAVPDRRSGSANDASTATPSVLHKISDYCLEGLRNVLPKESVYASTDLCAGGPSDGRRPIPGDNNTIRTAPQKGTRTRTESIYAMPELNEGLYQYGSISPRPGTPARLEKGTTTQSVYVVAGLNNGARPSESSSQLGLCDVSQSMEVQRRRAMLGGDTTTHGYAGERSSGVRVDGRYRVAAEVGGDGGGTPQRGTTLAFHLDSDPTAAPNPNPDANLYVNPQPDQLWINNARVY